LFDNGIWKGEVVTLSPNKEERYFLYSVTYFIDSQGLPTGIIAVGREVTDRKIAAEKLQQSELFYRNLIADSLDGIILSDASGSITFVAPSVKNILGYEAQEVMGRNCFEFVHPDDIAWAFESFQKEVGENPVIKSIVVRLKKRDGSWLWCMARGHNLMANPHIKSIVIYIHDYTLRKQASEALKESEKRFRNLIGELQVGVILSAPDASTIMCNKTICQMLMVPEEDFIGRNVYQVLPDDFVYEDGTYMPIAERPLSRAIQTKKNVKDVVLGFRQCVTGERLWVLINTDPVLDERGELLHIICTIKDITDRKRLEEELVAEQISHQKALTQATIDGQEKERREIGKELHDNVGQQLTTTKLFLDMAKTTADDGTAEMVSLALKGISDVINEVRTISHALVPPTLGDLGIIESIEELIEAIRYVQLIKIDFDYFDLNEDRVPENQQLMLYRIIQEGLNNIIKHADATTVSIVMKNTNRQLLLEIKDNGKGFNMATVRKGLGITNIKNRAELFDGKVTLTSTSGGGCTLKVVIPDKAPPATL
jgi:PAS domain S-box-containing protein